MIRQHNVIGVWGLVPHTSEGNHNKYRIKLWFKWKLCNLLRYLYHKTNKDTCSFWKLAGPFHWICWIVEVRPQYYLRHCHFGIMENVLRIMLYKFQFLFYLCFGNILSFEATVNEEIWWLELDLYTPITDCSPHNLELHPLALLLN